MKKVLVMVLILCGLMGVEAKEIDMSIYDFKVKTIVGEETTLKPYKGKTILIVNVASKCGFTKQYAGLQALYEKYKEQDFVVLGFPCNQFMSQEPGTEKEIQNFCQINFGVTFPLFSKIDVNGDNTHPLYVYLKSKSSGFLGSESIKWNFTKFLVDKKGNVIKRFGSSTEPKEIEKDIEKYISN